MSVLDSFIGQWHEQSKEGFDEMASRIGLSAAEIELYKLTRTAISYSKDGDWWVINVGLVGGDQCRQFKFQVGTPYDSADIDGTPMTSLVNVEDGKLTETHTKGALVMDMERWIENGQMKVKTSCKGIDGSMLSIYTKV